MNPSAIRDNYKHGSVGEFLQATIQPGDHLSIVSAYFTIYAYAQLKNELDTIEELRFLFGEPTFVQSLDPDKKCSREFIIEDDNLVIPIEKRLTQKATARECADWIKSKVAIRSIVRPNFLHGKMYHSRHVGGIEKALTGSSNFTVHGLGMNANRNIELNIIIDSDRDRRDLINWFDDLWNNDTGLVQDVKDEVLDYLSGLYGEHDPEFIYYKTLFHLFSHFVKDQDQSGLLNERTGFFDSEIWQALYEFQKDGVKGAINKILKHNGCIIADSVGLGKTYEALAIIKYFELLNHRVLVLCPKKLSANWTLYQASQNHNLNPFPRDRFGYTLLYHTDMGRTSGRSDANAIDLENFNWGAYDLVVIDESHNFRGNPMEKTRDDGSVKMNRAKWLMEKIIKSGVKTRVLMLSATPVNNTLRDLRNQISLITEGNDAALFESAGIKDLGLTLKTSQTQFTVWADRKKNPQRSLQQLLEKLDSAFFKLLDELTIARSRKHIINFYDLAAIGPFPERLKPISVYPVIDLQNRFPTYDRLNREILKYKLSVFNPSAYVRPEMRKKYEERAGTEVLAFTQKDRENFLIGMMKVGFLKRLESSIHSFAVSMDRTIRKIEALEQKIADYTTRALSGEWTLGALQPDEDEVEESNDDSEQWQVGKKLKFDLQDLNVDHWLTDLSKDKEALIDLYNNAKAVTAVRDAKLAELKKLIVSKQKAPLNKDNKKIIVFTAFADTAGYLYVNLRDWAQTELSLHSALVSGAMTSTTFGNNEYNAILTNFSPISRNRSKMTAMPQNDEIDLLIATDCISEGQNLQDCDYLINYDIHWNPVRIIQRFGRIDRLGSKNKSIQLVNFWPTRDLDNYINLKERVEARMALVDVTATGEDNILNPEQLQDLIADDLKFRNQQLKKLRDEVIDLEEIDETVSLTDFSLDDFRIELFKYLTVNRDKLENAPFGLYAVVPSPVGDYAATGPLTQFGAAVQEIRPGVIFCLRQKIDSPANEQVNPLQPWFLVYIRDDGSVRFNYTQAKQILEIYRLLCQGVEKPWEALCKLFNNETQDGRDMSRYSNLLQKAVAEITRIFKKRSLQKLTTDRGALLAPLAQQINETQDFELVTWLIIK